MAPHSNLVVKGVRLVFNKVTGLYFKNIQVRGSRNMPHETAIFAGNHPSGLIDPLVLMSSFPDKKISSVAKLSLFRQPLIGWFLDVMKAVPVVKPNDDGLKVQPTAEERARVNEEMFEIVRKRLTVENINIAIFPEGTCHSSYDIKELKTGTAKMAFDVADSSDGKLRVPIVPIGLTYSQPSGRVFRGSVLVDIGRPIYITDDLLALYRQNPTQACDIVTNMIEKYLRFVTVSIPDWREELDLLCHRLNLPKPEYRLGVSKELEIEETDGEILAVSSKDIEQKKICVHVKCGDRHFKSTVEVESERSRRRRRKQQKQGIVPDLPVTLQRQAARRAFFELSNAAGYNIFGENDKKFVDLIHLSRRIYKPEGIELSLRQYAALTRNFMYGFLRTPALSDSEFQKLWEDMNLYKSKLTDYDISDKAVAAHNASSDKTTSNKEYKNKALMHLVRASLQLPLGLMGHVIHLPIAAIVHNVSLRFGIGDDDDRSVEATYKVISAFVSMGIYYPLCGSLAYLYTGSLLSGPSLLGFMATCGYINATQRSFTMMKRMITAQMRAVTGINPMNELAHDRDVLQQKLRTLVDKYAPPSQVGWWKNPDYVDTILTADTFEKLEQSLPRLTIELKKNKRVDNERAVLTCIQHPISDFIREELIRTTVSNDPKHKFQTTDEVLNSKLKVIKTNFNQSAIIWIPGRNDSYFHYHVTERFLADGFDVFALDLRRCGRAKVDADGVEVTPELNAHDSYDFHEYFEEIDATFEFLTNPNDMHPKVLQRGGCGREYKNIIMYGHSTGALVASLYGKEGRYRNLIQGYIYNSPFWSFNLPWYASLVVKNSGLFQHVLGRFSTNPNVAVDESGHAHVTEAGEAASGDSALMFRGGAISDYSFDMHKSFKFSNLLKSEKHLNVTLGWVRAASSVQEMLQNGDLEVEQPVLCLFTQADVVLHSTDIDKLNNCLKPSQSIDGKDKPISSKSLVEREIGSSAWDPSSHDVLAAASRRRVNEAMNYIQEWLNVHFNPDHKTSDPTSKNLHYPESKCS